MKKYSVKYSQDFLNDISDIIRHIATISGSQSVARKFYSDVIIAIEKRSSSATCYEMFHPYKGSPEYYRLYLGKYIIFYVVNDGIMEVRRMLWSGSDIPNRIKR